MSVWLKINTKVRVYTIHGCAVAPISGFVMGLSSRASHGVTGGTNLGDTKPSTAVASVAGRSSRLEEWTLQTREQKQVGSGLVVSGEGHGLVSWKVGGWRAFMIGIPVADGNARHSMALNQIVSMFALL